MSSATGRSGSAITASISRGTVLLPHRYAAALELISIEGQAPDLPLPELAKPWPGSLRERATLQLGNGVALLGLGQRPRRTNRCGVPVHPRGPLE